MFRRNNRVFFSSVNRRARRAFKSMLRANRNDARWMERYQKRQQRLERFRLAMRKAFSFVPMVCRGLTAMIATMSHLFAAMFPAPTRPIRTSMSRSGMFGSGRKARRQRRKNARAKAKQESASSYENLEPRQLLAADLGLLAGIDFTSPDALVQYNTTVPSAAVVAAAGNLEIDFNFDSGQLTILDTANVNNELTVASSNGTTTITAFGGGVFDVTGAQNAEGLSLSRSGGLEGPYDVLTFSNQSVAALTLNGGGGEDTLVADGVGSDIESGVFDLTLIGGDGTDSYSLVRSQIAGLNPDADETANLNGETLTLDQSGVNAQFDGDANSSIVVVNGGSTIGDITSLTGFNTEGSIDIGVEAGLDILDSDTAVLGASTSIADQGRLVLNESLLATGDGTASLRLL